jgi:dephospho-CoA kinase
LTGTIGAGKSAALASFARHGAAVLDSDAIVHALYATEHVRDAVVAQLGVDVLDDDGDVDRAAVARLVFADDDLRRWLEGLIHPLVAEAVVEWVAARCAEEPPARALVHEVPLLFEAAVDDRYDRTLVITAAAEVRHRRIAARGGLEGLAEREARLLPEAEKLARADDVIVNDGDLVDLDREVAAYLDRIAS